MTESDEEVVFAVLLTILSYGVLPTMLVWGWARWIKLAKFRTVTSKLSVVGFILATASATLGVSTLVYAYLRQFAGGYDPFLYNVFRYGVWISVAGILFGLSGVWRQSSLRWHTPICALGALAFWMKHNEFFPFVN